MTKKRETTEEHPLTLQEAIDLLKEAEQLKHGPWRETGKQYTFPVAERSELLTAKGELCARIVRTMKRGMDRYYQRFPDREHDQRAIEAAFWSAAGVRVILMLIDSYDIRFKDEP